MQITLEELHELYEKTYGGTYEKGDYDHPEGTYRYATFPYDEGSLVGLCDAINKLLEEKCRKS
jgi:hypothetical protein